MSRAGWFHPAWEEDGPDFSIHFPCYPGTHCLGTSDAKTTPRTSPLCLFVQNSSCPFSSGDDFPPYLLLCNPFQWEYISHWKLKPDLSHLWRQQSSHWLNTGTVFSVCFEQYVQMALLHTPTFLIFLFLLWIFGISTVYNTLYLKIWLCKYTNEVKTPTLAFHTPEVSTDQSAAWDVFK